MSNGSKGEENGVTPLEFHNGADETPQPLVDIFPAPNPPSGHHGINISPLELQAGQAHTGNNLRIHQARPAPRTIASVLWSSPRQSPFPTLPPLLPLPSVNATPPLSTQHSCARQASSTQSLPPIYASPNTPKRGTTARRADIRPLYYCFHPMIGHPRHPARRGSCMGGAEEADRPPQCGSLFSSEPLNSA